VGKVVAGAKDVLGLVVAVAHDRLLERHEIRSELAKVIYE